MSNAILIIEQMDFQSMENKILVETIMDKQVKNYWLIGPHAEGGIVNGNGRTYPVPVVAKEVKRLNEKEIPNKRMLGELSHPSTIDINYERVSHLTTELKMENNIAQGRSLVLDTPMGKITKSLMDVGVKICTSTRGLGTLRESIVQNDWRWKCNDLVHDPSAPSAVLDAICENRLEWVLEDGLLTEKEVTETIAEVNKVIIEHQFSIEDRQSAFLKIFTDVLTNIKKK